GMIKKTNEEYLPLSIKIDPRQALDIRKNIIKATAKTFQPDLFIVDKEPLGMKKEILPTLKWIRRYLPGTKNILGLRDIMDEASVIHKDWRQKRIYKAMDELYDEIWVYGNKEFYDPIREYVVPEPVSNKMIFTGYIPRRVPSQKAVTKMKKNHLRNGEEKLIVVTAGGGGDGYVMMDAFLSMLESGDNSLPMKSVIITGPFMPSNERERITGRARKLGVRTWHFYRKMEEILAAADLVVTMGGYNTVCEILTQGSVSLIIPRETPRKEQLIRAQILCDQNFVDYIPWNALSPQRLREKVLTLLKNPKPYKEAISKFQLTGLDVIIQRLQICRNQCT
ncbi:glycosyltransferase family protein, partial [Thermodesulfobacteriota bacterium]